jgi:hypothetical protein
MKKLLPFILFILCSCKLFAAGGDDTDSLKRRFQLTRNSIDSLRLQLKTTKDSLKAPLYTQIATEYLKHDTVANKKTRLAYQNAAISNTITAIHLYSKYNDTVGLILSFDKLTKIYHAQHKYPQAKWFILQSNTLSRAKNDNPNIIASLLELASIKIDIKDYTLATADLNEALAIAVKNHYPQLESKVQLNFAMFYNKTKNYAKGDIALKRSHSIDDSIKRDEETRLMAEINSTDSVLEVKKKLYSINNRKPYRSSFSKKLASL